MQNANLGLHFAITMNPLFLILAAALLARALKTEMEPGVAPEPSVDDVPSDVVDRAEYDRVKRQNERLSEQIRKAKSARQRRRAEPRPEVAADPQPEPEPEPERTHEQESES